LLDQLGRETRTLYADVQSGMVRVQLPPPHWVTRLADCNFPPDTWDGLDADVKNTFLQSQIAYRQGAPVGRISMTIVPATQPAATSAVLPQRKAVPASATNPANVGAWRTIVTPGSGEITFESTGAGPGTALQIRTGGDVDATGQITHPGAAQLTFQPVSDFSPNNIGLLLDDQGRLVVPIYLEPDSIPAAGVKAQVGDNAITTAHFVASDSQTRLTILQLDKPQGKPVRLADARPADGSLVMMLAPNSGGARLEVWSGGQRDWGVVVGVDGQVAGFDLDGQFLGGSPCKAVIHQLILNHRVKRATLGITVRELFQTDPERQANIPLGSRPALRIENVFVGSAAEQAGLRAGDLLLSVADDPVGDPPSFAALISARSGATPMQVLRGGKAVTITLDLKPE
jgi:hypothetical protein